MDTENTALSPVPSDEPKLAASIYDWVETFCYAMALMVVLFLLVCRYVTVDGDSMRETLHHRDKLIISDLGYTPETGDIVVVKVPAYQNPIIKRVIATEGQEVEIDFENWTVKVDGVLLEEDYINRDVDYNGVNDDRYVWMALEIQMAPTGVNIRIACVFFFGAFIVGFNTPDLRPLILGKSQNSKLSFFHYFSRPFCHTMS